MMKRLVLYLWMVSGFCSVLWAQESDKAASKMVQVQVEFVELGHKDLTKLLFLAKPEVADATPLREKVAKMVEEGKAHVLETMMTTSKSGDIPSNTSVQEYIYPTEYDFPVPTNGKEDDSTGIDVHSVSNASHSGGIPFKPTAFETREIGSLLAVTPVISDDERSVELDLESEISWRSGTRLWLEHQDSSENRSTIEMPDIYLLRVNTRLTCASGKYQLVAVLSPKNADGIVDFDRKVMVFVKCDVMRVE